MYRSPFGHLPDEEYIEACKEDLRDLLRIAVSGDVACLLAEPIQGVGGFATPPDGFFGGIKEVLDEEGILFISDEVQTGWGRTGDHFWGYQAHGITPDVLTFAKGLGNGVAVAGVVGRAEIIDSIHTNSISTFGGNPLATATALANLEYLLANDLQTNAAKVGQQLRTDFEHLQGEVPNIGDVRGKGLMIGVEFVRAREQRTRRGGDGPGSWRKRARGGSSSARADCSATYCASLRRCRSPQKRPAKGSR